MRILSVAVLLAVVICTLPQSSTAEPLAADEITRIDAAVTSAMSDVGVPSVSIAIVTNGKLRYSKGYGWVRPGVRATEVVRYKIGSNSKAFTAAALILAAHQHSLSLSQDVSRFLPDLTDAREVSFRQILSHTSGYRDYWPQDYTLPAMELSTTPKSIVERWGRAPLDFSPGTRWQYSNTGYVVAGLIVQSLTKESLFDFMSREIFKPLRMKPILADRDLDNAGPIGYQRFAMGPVIPAPAPAPGWVFAAGDLDMSASDLARWDISIMNRSLFPAEVYTAMETETLLKSGVGTGYGLGLFVRIDKGRRVLRHGGEVPGFLSENRIYPDDKAAIVVLENADFGEAQVNIADAIENVLFQRSAHEPLLRSVISGLRAGQITDSAFTNDGRYYFRLSVLSNYRASLAMCGKLLDLRLRGSSRRGGFDGEVYDATFEHRNAKIVLLLDTNHDPKIEQFILTVKTVPKQKS